MFPGTLRLPVATLLLIAAGPLYHQYAVSAGVNTVAARLSAVTIDVKLDYVPVATALNEVRQKLAQKDAFFQTCSFQLDAPESGYLISMDLVDVPGDECLKYVAELSANRCYLRPRKVVIANHHSDQRDIAERATDSTVDWFRAAREWMSLRLGGPPPAPLDPFAPAS